MKMIGKELDRHKKLIVLVLVVGLLSSVLIGCSQENTEVSGDKQQGEAEKAVPVQVDEAKTGKLKKHITAMGETKPVKSVKVTPELQAQVEKKYVEVSDKVNKGDNLLQLNQDTFLNQVKQARASLKAAQANLDNMLAGTREEKLAQLKAQLEQAKTSYEEAEKSYRRQQKLYEKGAISKQQLERSETQYVSAKTGYQSAKKSLELAQAGATKEEINGMKAKVAQAKAGLEAAKLRLKKTEVTAPISGIISNVNIETGEMVTRQPVISIANIDVIKVITHISERYINRLQVGDRVEVKFAALNKNFPGEINRINPVADQRQKRFPVKILIDNKDHLIKAGMHGEIKFEVTSSKKEIVLPQNSVLSDEGQQYVYILENGEAVKRKVKTGLMSKGKVIILDGIEPGEEVITNGQEQITAGDRVQVVNRGGQ